MAILRRVSKSTGKPRYQVLIDRRDPSTGARGRITVGTFATKKEAERAEAEAITQRERGTLLRPDKATVGELLDEYLAVEAPKTVRPENLDSYVSTVQKRLKPAIGHIEARRLTTEHVERMMAGMIDAGLSSSSVTKARMRLSSALRLGQRWGIVGVNVAEAAKPPKIETQPSRVWSPEETGQFLRAAREHRLWPFWLLAVETGARQSELAGLTWDDVDLDAGTLRLGRQVVRLLRGRPILKPGGKSKAASRAIRITPGTAEELRTFRKAWLAERLANGPEWNPGDVIFTNADGGLLNMNNVRTRDYDGLVKAAGVPDIKLHEIRKTNITAAVASGANPKAVSRRVGHSDSRITLDTYSSIVAEMDDDLLAAMERLVSGGSRAAAAAVGDE